MKWLLVTATALIMQTGYAGAVDLSLSPASSLSAAPIDPVSRNTMAPPEGFTESAPKARPAYSIENTRYVSGESKRIEVVPNFNPLKVYFCQGDIAQKS
jgi:hypothetical protein